MYGGFLLIIGAVVVFLSPAIWVAWWLLADLGEKMTGSAAGASPTWQESARRAA